MSTSKSFSINQKGWAPILIVLILAALVVGLLALGGYFLYQQQTKTTLPASSPTQTITQPSPTPDETSTWKTYTDKINGYSIKYPTDWEISQDQPSGLQKMISGINIKKVINPSYVSIIVYNNQENLSIEEFIKKYISSGSYDFTSVEFKPIYLDGIEGKRTKNLPRLTVGEDAFVKKGNNLYHISLNIYGEVGKDTFNQILSTFRFLP